MQQPWRSGREGEPPLPELGEPDKPYTELVCAMLHSCSWQILSVHAEMP